MVWWSENVHTVCKENFPVAREDFKAETTDYDVNQIYIGKATDDNGHSTNLRCNLPTHWSATILELINSPQWPEYNSMQSFIRDAVHHRMNWAGEQTDRGRIESVQRLRAIENMKQAIARHTYFQAAYEQMMEEMQETFRAASVHHDREVLMALASEVETAIKDFPEPMQAKLHDELDYWKRRTL